MALWLAFIILLSSPSAYATIYYVATTGSNSNDGLTTETPKLTIAHTVGLMVAGDTTYVRGGTYNESEIRFDTPGTETLPIKLLNYPGETPIINFTGQTATYRILIQNASGSAQAMGWITIEGFQIRNGYDGIKWYNLHDSTIKRNWIHGNRNQGILGNGGTRVTIIQNIVSLNGPLSGSTSNLEHGIYAHGSAYVITRNVIYGNQAYGIQQNGSSTSTYSPTTHPSPEFATAANWIISDNTFAYEYSRSGIVVWGGACDNTRIENNIFYENNVGNLGSTGNGIQFTSASGSTGVLVRNNHFYASGSGATAATSENVSSTGVPGTPPDLVFTGNVVNVSAPAFVDGGSNVLPSFPDFRLTTSSPVNIARANEFLNNTTNVVGAYKTVSAPTASIHANTVTLTFPMSTAVPIQVPSAIGVSIGCTGANCPGSPTVGSASRKTGADSQAEVVINGISSDACVATNQNWTITYNSSTGGWTGFDDIGPYPGLHQKVFSFTNLAVTNLCDGTGPGSGVGTPLITYKFDEGTGTTATNTGSSGSGDNGTLAGGAGWTTGKTGTAVNSTGGTQQVQVPYLPGDPTTNSQTWVLAVNVLSGGESTTRYTVGTQIGTNQRLYIGAVSGTWRVGVQNTSISSAGSSNLTVTAGWQLLCMNVNSATDTVTLYKNDVAGTGGATRSYTSFTPTGEILIGLTGTGFSSSVAPAAYDDFDLYETVEDCSSIYASWNPPPVAVGTFGMPSHQFQAVYLPELGGSPTNLTTAINTEKNVVAGGAVAVLLEAHCQNVADCEQDSFRLEARQDGAGSYLQVPNTETATKIWMWGADANTLLNAGSTTSRLSAGSCTVTNGVTVLTSDQVPVVDLPQDGCVVLRYIVRIGTTASGYYDLRLSQQNGTPFAGTVNPARINVIPMQAGVR